MVDVYFKSPDANACKIFGRSDLLMSQISKHFRIKDNSSLLYIKTAQELMPPEDKIKKTLKCGAKSHVEQNHFWQTAHEMWDKERYDGVSEKC